MGQNVSCCKELKVDPYVLDGAANLSGQKQLRAHVTFDDDDIVIKCDATSLELCSASILHGLQAAGMNVPESILVRYNEQGKWFRLSNDSLVELRATGGTVNMRVEPQGKMELQGGKSTPIRKTSTSSFVVAPPLKVMVECCGNNLVYQTITVTFSEFMRILRRKLLDSGLPADEPLKVEHFNECFSVWALLTAHNYVRLKDSHAQSGKGIRLRVSESSDDATDAAGRTVLRQQSSDASFASLPKQVEHILSETVVLHLTIKMRESELEPEEAVLLSTQLFDELANIKTTRAKGGGNIEEYYWYETEVRFLLSLKIPIINFAAAFNHNCRKVLEWCAQLSGAADDAGINLADFACLQKCTECMRKFVCYKGFESTWDRESRLMYNNSASMYVDHTGFIEQAMELAFALIQHQEAIGASLNDADLTKLLADDLMHCLRFLALDAPYGLSPGRTVRQKLVHLGFLDKAYSMVVNHLAQVSSTPCCRRSYCGNTQHSPYNLPPSTPPLTTSTHHIHRSRSYCTPCWRSY
jgi:hypothetical protein